MARHQAQARARDAVSGVEQYLGQPPVAPDERTKEPPTTRSAEDTLTTSPYATVRRQD